MPTQPKRAAAWRMMRRICAVAACALALALAGAGLADLAPPEQPPGSNIGPGGQTQVQMAAERVVLDIRPREPSGAETNLAGDRAEAAVSADFTMRNLGAADEQMQVRFPLGDPQGRAYSGFPSIPQVQGFGATVAGQPVSTGVITTPNPLGGDAPPIPWAAFDVTFPAGQDLSIGVTYTITPTGYTPEARFAYVLETGAGWRDTIGSADIVARLPYAASDENLILDGENAPGQPKTSPGAQLVGNEVRWHWDNLEPTAQNNLFITVLVPNVWQKILDTRAAVKARPDDADALVALANAYDAAVTHRFPTYEGDRYATLSEQTYERAIALQPNSATLHAGFARLLWKHMAVQALLPPDDPNVRRVLHELSAALALDPQNADARALLEEVRSGVNGPLTLETPTAAPESTVAPPAATSSPPAATAAPQATTAPPADTIAPQPTAALPAATSGAPLTPTLTLGPAPTPAPAAPSNTGGIPPLLGAIAVIAVLMAIVVALLRRRSAGA